MSVVFSSGATAWGCREDEKGHREYFVTLNAKVDTQATGPAEVLAAAPYNRRANYQVGFDYDNYAFCKGREIALIGPTVYAVTFTFSTEFDQYQNPLDEPPKVSYDTELIETIVDETKDAPPEDIVNAAGDFFDPPVQDFRAIKKITVKWKICHSVSGVDGLIESRAV